MTEKYQIYRLTLALDNNLVSTIEPKVTQTYFYASKHQKFLPANISGVYLTLVDVASQIELYLKDNKDTTTCLWYPYRLVDVAYIINQLFNSPITTYSFIEELPNITRSTSILEALCLKLQSGLSSVEKIEKVLSMSNDFVSRRWWNRQCYITSSTGTYDIIDLLYGNESSAVGDLINEILRQQYENDYTLMGVNHPLALIFNIRAQWKSTQTIPNSLPTFTNWFEAIYYYAVVKEILMEVIS